MGERAQGRLLFEDADGNPYEVTGEKLGCLLADKGVPPIVLLNACQSGMTRPESLFPSVGNQLLKVGVGGVVAMAYSVYLQTVVQFMASLYEGLLNGEELGRAVALARKQLRANVGHFSPIGEVSLRDWMVPILFEATTVRLMTQPLHALHFSPDRLQDQLARAGAEIDGPESPAFGLIGRSDTMLTLERAFHFETIVLLEGMAGVGKTEAAVGFARWWAETGALGGPIFFFSFEHYLPLARICDRVGQTFKAAIRQQWHLEWNLLDEEQRRQVAIDILNQAPCLLIWDNFEPVAGFPTGSRSVWTADEQKELSDFLSALRGGKTKVLLTSRRDEPWIGNIYRSVEVGGLKLMEAQELAVKVLQHAGLKPPHLKTLSQYNDLLRYLRGNPLAIQVILPELRQTQPDALLAALQSGEVALREDDPEQGREHSLTASLSYRFNVLDPVLRRRFGLIGLFQGFVAADVVASICERVKGAPETIRDLKREDWLQILDSAEEVGVLRRVDKGFYTVHPALPWFLHKLLQEMFPDQSLWLECAYATVYGLGSSQMCDLFSNNPEAALRLLRAEENNLTHSLALARKHKLWVEANDVLRALWRLWTIQGRWVEWERLIADLEQDVMDSNCEPLAGRENLWIPLMFCRSEIAVNHRDFDKAKDIQLRLKGHFEHSGNEGGLATALFHLGRIAEEQEQFDEAEQRYRQCLAIRERLHNEHGQAGAIYQLGIIALKQRRFEKAEQLLRQTLTLWEQLRDKHGQAAALHELGIILIDQGRFDEAYKLLQRSLAIKQCLGDMEGQQMTLPELSNIALVRRWFNKAESYLQQSLAINKVLGDEYVQTRILHALGRVAEEQEQFDEAVRWYRQSLEIQERLHDEYGQAMTFQQLGMIALKQRRFDEADQWYHRSIDIAKRIDNQYMQAVSLYHLGMIASDQQQFDEAERLHRQNLAIVVNFGDEQLHAATLDQLGSIAEGRNDMAQAVDYYEQAAAMLERIDDQYHANIVHRSLQIAHAKLTGG